MAWTIFPLFVAVLAQIQEDPTEKTRLDYINEISSGFYGIEPFLKADGDLAFRTSYALEKGHPMIGVELDLSITSFDVYEWAPYLTLCSEECRLAARLIYLRFADKSQSFFSRYVKGLAHIIHSTSAWTEAELDALEEYNLLHNTINHKTFVADSFERFKLLTSGKLAAEYIDYNAWRWAFAHVTRGSIGLPLKIWKLAKGYRATEDDEERQGLAFYPMIETIKHCPVKNSERSSIRMSVEQKPVLVYMHAERKFRSDEELCFEHGALTNLRLLFQEGRVIFPNPYDTFIHAVENDKPEYCEELFNIQECVFSISLTLSDEMLLYVRAYTSRNAALKPHVDYAEYYKGLGDDSEEPKLNFLKSAMLYRREFKRYVIQPLYTKPLREMRRLALKEKNPHLKAAIELGITGVQMLYKHLEASDRLLMSLYTADLDL